VARRDAFLQVDERQHRDLLATSPAHLIGLQGLVSAWYRGAGRIR
jgi:hypothetical protein